LSVISSGTADSCDLLQGMPSCVWRSSISNCFRSEYHC
jgi:hypothetical protein